jgi:hypothetical protein
MRSVQALVCAALALCGTVAAVGPARAGGASGTLSELQVTLIDLDPNDGVAPWISYALPPELTWRSRDPFLVSQPEVRQSFAQGAAASASTTYLGYGLSLSVLGGALPSAAALVQGSGPGDLTGEVLLLHKGFTLSPNTRIEVRGYATASAFGHEGANNLFFGGANLSIINGVSAQDLLADTLVAFSSADTVTAPPSRGLFIRYSNSSPQVFSADLYANAFAGSVALLPVPEPTTVWLLALGVAGLGWRRASQLKTQR